MTAVEVAKLKLRCDVRERDRARFAIEDALRTTIPDDRRLVLLRKMHVASGASSINPARRQAAVRDGWLAAVAGARHGGEDSASGANCVWFESREEAEILLLSRLLAGRALDGWYWNLAVPGWQGRPLRPWLAESLAESLTQGDDRRMLAIARSAIAAGSTDRVVEALAESTAGRGFGSFCHTQDNGASQMLLRTPSPSASGSVGPGAATAPISVPPALYATIARLIRAGGDAPAAARAILRAWTLRQSPALALSPALLASTVAATLEEIGSPGSPKLQRQPTSDTLPTSPRPGQRPPSAGAAAQVAPGSRAPHEESRRLPPKETPAPELAAVDSRSRPAKHEEAPAARERHHSRHAGLWLVVPSLVALGFREWLAGQPALLADNPGSLLLHAIARHHSIDSNDPALLALVPPPELDPLPEWARLWRHGLDRWLRRTARRRLHDLVHRPGALDWDAWSLDIRYPGAAADIALRRRALDRDPGWTDWLGLSIRYHFGGQEDRL